MKSCCPRWRIQEIIVHQEVGCPYLFSNRDIMMDVVGCILPEKNALCCIAKSEEKSKWYGIDVPAPIGSTVRSKLNNSFSYIQILNDEETLMRSVVSIDFNVKFMPWWFLNYFMNKGVTRWMERVKNLCCTFEGTNFERKLNERAIYRYIQKRVEDGDDDSEEGEF